MREEPSDGELLRRLAHDPAALGVFYRRHFDRIVGYLARRLSTPSDVADAAQDVFLGVIESADSYDPSRGEPIPWLLGIAHHVVAQHRHERRRRSALDARGAGRDLLDDDDFARLERRIDAEREADALRPAIAQLSPRQREILDLIVSEGLSVTQAAFALGVPSVTARMRLMRARKAIQHATSGACVAAPAVKAKEERA
jgi:RNA polymerase sigma-70 factor (ECF subfamily)